MKNITLVLSKDKSKNEFYQKIASHPLIHLVPLSEDESFKSILKEQCCPYVCFLNQFDEFPVHRFEKILEEMLKAKAKWAFSYVSFKECSGQSVSFNHPIRKEYESQLMKEATFYPTISFQLLDYHLPLTLGNLIFHRDLLPLLQGNFKEEEDASKYFCLKAMQDSEPLFVTEFLYEFELNQLRSCDAKMHHHPSYREYLFQACETVFENSLSPSPWTWPRLFAQEHLKMELPSDNFYQHLTYFPTRQKIASKLEAAPPITSSAKAITLLTHELSLSGAPKLVSDLAFELRKEGFNPQVISLKTGPLTHELSERGIPFYIVPEKITQDLFNIKKIKKTLAIMKLLAWVYPKISGQIIANSLMSWPIMLPLLVSFPRRNFYWYIHESFSPFGVFPRMLSDKRWDKIINSKQIQFWFGSESTCQFWKNYGIEGHCFYWSGISPQKIHSGKSKSTIQLLAVGTASARKGTHYLIKAFIKGIKENRFNEKVKLKIIGFPLEFKDPFLEDLIDKVAKENLTDRIEMIYSLDHQSLEPFYREADIFIQPSVNECLPLTLLQAMSMGKTIITTDTFGCKEAVEDLVNGYVCVTRDTEALLEKIEEAIKGLSQDFSMGIESQKRFKELFCLEVTSQKIIDYLKNAEVKL